VRSCLALVRYNASRIRSFVTPEVWNSIQGANAVLAGPASRPPAGTALRDVMEAAVRAGDQIYGTAHRTLLHDAGWHFLNTGLLLERSVNHVTILAQVMPRIAQRQWEHLRDDTDLTALLRLMGALDAYHRRYRSRAYLDRVAQLLWQTPSCTGSVIHAVLEIQSALQAVFAETGGQAKVAAIAAQLQEFADWLTGLRLEQIFPARALELDRGLTRRNAVSAESIDRANACLQHMRTTMEGLHARLEDVFFSHHPDLHGGTA
jgi:uncharacterized alpha-E superfamily protein